MPVTFYIDPEIENDREGRFINQITLSYTFFEQDLVDEASLMLHTSSHMKFN